MQTDRPFISVIVPVYNGSQFLPRCLTALYASTFRSFEVIVVDDCSTDNSADIGRKIGARVLSLAQNSGPAMARNLGAQPAEGEILVFVDADVVVKADTFARIVHRFKTQSEISALFGSYDDTPAEQNFLSQYKNLQHHFIHQTSNSEASTFWSGLGAIRREVFIGMGGFDCRKFEVPSIEDIEFGARLRGSGHRILLDKDIQAQHLKKWQIVSHLRTEILCRALPWSRLILTGHGLINDMNLKVSDRLSAALVALSIIAIPFVFWQPTLILLIAVFLLAFGVFNRKILRFYASKKGVLFAVLTLPWQLLYFFYSGVTFVLCWLWYVLPVALGFKNREQINES